MHRMRSHSTAERFEIQIDVMELYPPLCWTLSPRRSRELRPSVLCTLAVMSSSDKQRIELLLQTSVHTGRRLGGNIRVRKYITPPYHRT